VVDDVNRRRVDAMTVLLTASGDAADRMDFDAAFGLQ
jgi:hypothetical protein